MEGFGPWELFILLVVLVLVLLAWRVRALGRSRTTVRRASPPPSPPPAPPPVPMVECAACQASVPAANKFCPACGATLSAPTEVVEKPPGNTCPSCATVNPPGQPFCGQCGAHLTPAAA